MGGALLAAPLRPKFPVAIARGGNGRRGSQDTEAPQAINCLAHFFREVSVTSSRSLIGSSALDPITTHRAVNYGSASSWSSSAVGRHSPVRPIIPGRAERCQVPPILAPQGREGSPFPSRP
jgi:hypothetical protein